MLIACHYVPVFTHAHFSVHWDLSRFKFDDERVTKEDVKRALEEQYGGEEEVLFSGDCLLKLIFLLCSCFLSVDTFLSYILPFNSYRRQILGSTTLHLNLLNIQMHICLCIYEKVTRTK